MIAKCLVCTLITFYIVPFVHSTPEKADCNWVLPNEVARIRDLSDCSKFYYCIKGKAPFRASCPTNNQIFLWFEPNSGNCDLWWKAPEDCFGSGTGTGTGGGSGGTTTTTTTTTTVTPTTEAPTTEPPTTEPPTTEPPTTEPPTTEAPTTEPPTTEPPTTEAPTTAAPTTEAPTTAAPTTVATTTVATTTEATTLRPPLLNDKSNFSIDCSVKVCGIFPNTYGACDTFVICVNGQKIIKKCNGGQLFDIKTSECQPANIATCWKEPNAGPHIRSKGYKECPYHGNAPTTPIQTVNNGVILQNPVVTNWGTWQNWVNCPTGMYATGIYAWRRLLMQGTQTDHAGIVAVSFTCQTPGGNETNRALESLAPGLPRDGWPFYYMCRGAVVGIRLNSVKANGWGTDQLATDNIQGMCSCSGPVYKPYEEIKYYPQNGNRGTWTAPQYCKRGQAICGMQTQMQDYKEYLLGVYDNNGMNNIKVKCCDVPDPLDQCVPKEERLFIRDCDNSKSFDALRCDFDAMVGLSIDYDTANHKTLDFYSSVGYTFSNSKKDISDRIERQLSNQIKSGATLEYTWDNIVPAVMTDMKVTAKTMYLQPYEKLKLYQIVGKCGYFLVGSNRYLRIITDARTGSVTQNYFEI